MIRKKYTLNSINGLSSRSSLQLVNISNKYDSELILEFNEERANLKSIMSVMALIIKNKESFIIEADGEDENDAINALEELMNGIKLI